MEGMKQGKMTTTKEVILSGCLSEHDWAYEKI